MSQLWLGGSLRLFIALATTALAGCGNPPYPRGTVDSLFPTGQRPAFATVQVQNRTLNVARVDNAQNAKGPMLLFIHGSPGDWKAWSYYLRSPELARMGTRVAVDRPGFGGSTAGGVMPNLREQAALLTQLIPPGQKAIVVGHSLGGPLVAWMAIDAPDKVCGAVSIAGSLSSLYEAPRWYNLLASWAVVSWAIPPEMIQSNHEMMPLADELAKLEPLLGKLQVPLIVMQGGKDSLVAPRTADEVEKRSSKAWVTVQRLPLENHFVLWEKPQLVIDAIRSLPCV
jgi:pimeloyl-ACP methyl ester carboxylesterase